MSNKLRDLFTNINYSTSMPDVYLTSFRPKQSCRVTYTISQTTYHCSWIDESLLDMEVDTVLTYYNLGLITSDPCDEDELISYLTSLK